MGYRVYRKHFGAREDRKALLESQDPTTLILAGLLLTRRPRRPAPEAPAPAYRFSRN
jgi:hypothetical protein